MSLQPDQTVSQEPQTASKKAESRLKYALAQNAALRTLDRKVLDEGLRMQWKFFSEDDKMFGSLNIRGGYVAHNFGTWRKDISSSSPKDILNLKQYLAIKVLAFWEVSSAWHRDTEKTQANIVTCRKIQTQHGFRARKKNRRLWMLTKIWLRMSKVYLQKRPTTILLIWSIVYAWQRRLMAERPLVQ